MPTFTNTSQSVFQDGDLEVLPGDSFSTTDEGRMAQMRGLYKWQSWEAEGEDGPSEDEVKEPPSNTREIRDHAFVSSDGEDVQEEVVGHSA